jgi:hypothetical protein
MTDLIFFSQNYFEKERETLKILILVSKIMREHINYKLQKFFKTKLSFIILCILILNVLAAIVHIFYKFYFKNEYGLIDYAELFFSSILLLVYYYFFVKNKY